MMTSLAPLLTLLPPPPFLTINYFQVIVSKYPCRADYKVYWFSLGSSYAFVLIPFLLLNQKTRNETYLSLCAPPPRPLPSRLGQNNEININISFACIWAFPAHLGGAGVALMSGHRYFPSLDFPFCYCSVDWKVGGPFCIPSERSLYIETVYTLPLVVVGFRI